MPFLLTQVNPLFLLDLLDARAPLIAVRNLSTPYLPTATCVNNGLANRRDDRVLNYLLKIRMYGQAQYFSGKPLGYLQSPRGGWEPFIGSLTVEGERI